MIALMSALGCLVAGGILSLSCARRPAFARWIGGLTGLVAGALAVISGGQVLCGRMSPLTSLAWPLPGAAITLQIDALSAFFLLVIGLVSGLSALYGVAYLESYQGHKNLGLVWFFYHLLFAGMLVVVTSRNAVLFLVAWEVMAVASFFLVMFEHEQPEVTKAGWIYLAATHLGTAFLLAFFVLLGQGSSSLDFTDFRMPTTGVAGVAMFLLAVIGFGTKAGFIPMHMWLPEAHPAAPSFVSAVMSGVMIKTGIYGLLRVLTWAKDIPAWWGWTFVGIGATSGILGVLFALAQHDLKRLLAYHSVENIGIITLGLGIGVLGLSSGNGLMATLGLCGGILHVLNHAVFKGLLFLGAGAVLQATHTRDIEHLGGLLKRMGTTAATFLIAAAAISGLPPLNGFVSEFLIYLSSFTSLSAPSTSPASGGVIVIGSLALIGGLAAACFTKAFGIMFLGEPRSPEAARAHEASTVMRIPMLILATLCVILGLLGPLLVRAIQPVAALVITGKTGMAVDQVPLQPMRWLLWISGGAVVLAIGIVCLILIRRSLLHCRPMGRTGTWDCGYVAPTPRMQYTASSFAEPIIGLFRTVLRPHVDLRRPEGLFPPSAGTHTHTSDLFTDRLYRPLFTAVAWMAQRLRWLQQGHIQMYVLYIAITVLVLLLWKLGVPS
jgi:hydrogenase-4 component B